LLRQLKHLKTPPEFFSIQIYYFIIDSFKVMLTFLFFFGRTEEILSLLILLQ